MRCAAGGTLRLEETVRNRTDGLCPVAHLKQVHLQKFSRPRPSVMKMETEFPVYLPRVVVVKSAKRQTIVQLHASVGHV